MSININRIISTSVVSLCISVGCYAQADLGGSVALTGELSALLSDVGIESAAMTPSLIASAPAAAVSKWVVDWPAFWNSVSQFGQTISNVSQQIAIAESTVDNIMGTNSILGKALKISDKVGKYNATAQALVDLYRTSETYVNTCSECYDQIMRLAASGKITGQEAAMMGQAIGRSVSRTGSYLSFWNGVIADDSMSLSDFRKGLDDTVQKLKNQEEAIIGIYTGITKPYEAKEKNVANKVNGAFRGQGDGKLSVNSEAVSQHMAAMKSGNSGGKDIFNFDFDKAVREVADESNTGTGTPTITEVRTKTFTTSFWTSFCNFLCIVWALVVAIYLCWNFIIKQHGNPQNQDALQKAFWGFVGGEILLILFKAAIIPAIGGTGV